MRIQHLLIATFLLSDVCNAQTNNVEANSIGCSSIFFVMTSVPEYEGMEKFGVLMNTIFGIHRSKTKGTNITNGDIFTIRDDAAKYWGKRYEESPQKVSLYYSKCEDWVATIVEYFSSNGVYDQKNPIEGNALENIIFNVPLFPENFEPPEADVLISEKAIENSFGPWVKAGMKTPTDIKKEMENLINENSAK